MHEAHFHHPVGEELVEVFLNGFTSGGCFVGEGLGEVFFYQDSAVFQGLVEEFVEDAANPV